MVFNPHGIEPGTGVIPIIIPIDNELDKEGKGLRKEIRFMHTMNMFNVFNWCYQTYSRKEIQNLFFLRD